MERRTILDIAGRQGGYIHRKQLATRESKATIWRKIRTGEYVQVSDNVLRVVRLPGLIPLLRGAVLALPSAIVSHRSAATLHGFPGIGERAEVTVFPHASHRFEGVTVHRTDDLSDLWVTSVTGLPVTSAARTVFDLAADMRPSRLETLVQELIVANAVTLEDLERVVGTVGRRGKAGTAAMRATLSKLGRGDHVTFSALERAGLAILESESRLPPAVPQYPVPWATSRRFDVAFPPFQVAIEWDSRRWHAALDRMESDRRRDRSCAAHGWILLRFTWHEVTQRPDDVVESILSVIERRRHSAG